MRLKPELRATFEGHGGTVTVWAYGLRFVAFIVKEGAPDLATQRAQAQELFSRGVYHLDAETALRAIRPI